MKINGKKITISWKLSNYLSISLSLSLFLSFIFVVYAAAVQEPVMWVKHKGAWIMFVANETTFISMFSHITALEMNHEAISEHLSV